MFTIDDTVRPIGLTGNGSAGIGWITILDSDEIDRDQFVEDCYRSHTVTLYGGIHYGYFFDVSVDKEIMKTIEFPKQKGEFGSPVVWVNIEPYNKPVIVACLKSEGEYYLNNEGEYNVSRENGGNHIDVSIKTKEAIYEVSVMGGATPGKMKFNLIDANKKGEYSVYVKGTAKIHATEEVRIVSDKMIRLHVLDENSKDKVVITYEREKGLTYIDEFENEINIKDGQIQIKSDKINHNEGKEPMVLGNTLKSILSDTFDAITALTVPTAFGPSGTPINASQFSAIKARLDNILSQISNLD